MGKIPISQRAGISGAAALMLAALVFGSCGRTYAQVRFSERPEPMMHSAYGKVRGSGLSEKELYRQWRRAQELKSVKRTDTFHRPDQQLSPQAVFIDEGFEGATFPPAGWTDTVVAGDPDWVQSFAGESPHSGVYSAYSGFSSGVPAKKYLITKRLTLNGLLLYRLTFWIQRAFADPFFPDTVYVKLSTIDSLPANFTTTLYKCYTGPDTSTDPNIYTTAYKQFAVEFTGISGTAWIAFDHEDTEGQGLFLDDVRFDEIVNNDILAFSVDDPVAFERKNIGAAFQPKATFRNNGVMAQTNIPVRFKIVNALGTVVYNNTQTISSLAPDISTQVTFSSFTPSSPGNYTARALAQNPGDTNTGNDSVQLQFRIPDNISGTKTVGPGGDFTTLNDAVRYLNDNNVAGPLTFSLTSSSYSEDPIPIDPIHYTTTQQPVVVRPAAGVTTAVTIAATPASPYGLRIAGASNLTLDGSNDGTSTRNMTIIIDTSGYFAPGILLTNGCKNVTIKNAIVKGYSRFDGTGNNAIVLDSVTAGKRDSNIVFNNLHVLRAFNGFFLRGPGSKSFRVTVSNCDFGGTGIDAISQAGIIARYIDSLTISSNDIRNVYRIQGPSDLFGIVIRDGCTNGILSSNIIHDIRNDVNSQFAYGVINGSGAGSNLLCVNNMIYNIGSVGSGSSMNFSVGLFSSNSANTGERYFYNSIFLYGHDSSAAPASFSAGIYVENGVSSIELKNNIVVNSMTFGGSSAGTKGYCLYSAAAAWPGGSTSTYNDLYASGTQGAVGYITGLGRVTLSDWQAASSQDGASISADPLFMSNADLHIQAAGGGSPVDGKGTPIAGVTTDIDNEPRHALTPDIGADEFDPPSGVKGVVRSGWNMISLPVNVADPRVATIFPAGRISRAFAYAATYITKDTLVPGVGYWLKFSVPESVVVDGVPRNKDTIDVSVGWNLIGSLSRTIHKSAVTTLPGGLFNGTFYGYNGIYFSSDSLLPFKGYWMKAAVGGKVIFTKPGVATPAVIPRREDPTSLLTTADRLIISDAAGYQQTLYIARREMSDLSAFELPPVPPGGGFDARFASGRLLELRRGNEHEEFPLELSSVSYPITVRWEGRSYGNNASLSIDGKSVKITDGGDAKITNPESRVRLVLENESDLPKEFALEQNFPNPFNPATTVKYSLPVASHVKIALFNILGQEVAVLVDELQEAGFRSVSFHAKNLPSGVYTYRITAGSFTETKRMMLVK